MSERSALLMGKDQYAALRRCIYGPHGDHQWTVHFAVTQWWADKQAPNPALWRDCERN